MVEQLDIELQRNAQWVREIPFTDSDGNALDLTGATFQWDFKMRAGDLDPPIASATIDVTDAAGGLVTVAIAGSNFDAVDGDFETVRMAHDCLATQDGIVMAVVRGSLNLIPGVS